MAHINRYCHLPTLAIIDGLLVSIDNRSFVLPLSVVEECFELRREATQTTGGNLANVRGSLVPYIRLRELFKINGEAPDIEQIVISHVKGQRIGFVVDTVIGEHKTVIKSLGKIYHGVLDFQAHRFLAMVRSRLFSMRPACYQTSLESCSRATRPVIVRIS